MDLLALLAFQRIADHGGIGRASRASDQPKTTLSRRLRRLEEELGTRLVERGPKTFRLTEEGAALHLRVRDLLAEIEEAGLAVAGGLSRPRGRAAACASARPPCSLICTWDELRRSSSLASPTSSSRY